MYCWKVATVIIYFCRVYLFRVFLFIVQGKFINICFIFIIIVIVVADVVIIVSLIHIHMNVGCRLISFEFISIQPSSVTGSMGHPSFLFVLSLILLVILCAGLWGGNGDGVVEYLACGGNARQNKSAIACFATSLTRVPNTKKKSTVTPINIQTYS